MAVTYNTSGEGNTIGSNSKGVLYTTLTPEGPQINFMDHAGNLINTFDNEEAGRAFLDADTDFNRYNALQQVGTPTMVASPFASAPINDLTGKISNNKGGGAPAMTMAIGEDGTGAITNPPAAPGTPVSASTLAVGEDGGVLDATRVPTADPADTKGGGAPLMGEPTVVTTAFGEEGTAPGAPPVGPFAGDTPVGSIENTEAVLPGFGAENTRAIGEDNSMLPPPFPPVANPIDPNVQIDLGPPQTGMTRAIGEDGNGPSLADLIGKEPFNEVTTMAIGEEGDEPPFPGGEILQPPGGGQMITQAMFEDGMPTPPAPPVANPYQPQPRPPMSGGKGGGMQPQPQPFQPQPFQPYQPQPFMPQPPMYGGGYGMPYGGSFGSPYGNPYGGGFGGGYGMQRPQPFGGSFYGNPYMPPPPPTPYGGGKGGGFGQQQMPQPPMNPVQGGTQPPAYNQQPMGKGGGAQPQQPPQGVSSGTLGAATTQAYAEDDFIAPPKDPNAPSPLSNPGGLFGMLGAGSLLGGQQNTGGSSNNASPFGGSSGGGSRTAMF